MSGCKCRGDDPCAFHLDGIDAREDARAGHSRGYSDRELDFMADAAAADRVFGREW